MTIPEATKNTRKFLGFSAREIVVGLISFVIGQLSAAYNTEVRNYIAKPAVLAVCRVSGHYERARQLRREGLDLQKIGQKIAADAKFQEANRLHFEAYHCGSDDSAYALGMAFCKGGVGLPRDPNEALKYLRFAKEAGHPFADMFLGQFMAECTQ